MRIKYWDLYEILFRGKEKIKIDEHIMVLLDAQNLYIYIDDILVFDWYIFSCKPTYYYKIPRKAIKIINSWSKNAIKQIKENIDKKERTIQNHINTLYEK